MLGGHTPWTVHSPQPTQGHHSPRPLPTMAQCRRDKCRVAWELGKSLETAPRCSPVRKFCCDSISHRVTQTPDLGQCPFAPRPRLDSGVDEMDTELDEFQVTRHEKNVLFDPTPSSAPAVLFAPNLWVIRRGYCVCFASLAAGTVRW